MGTAKQLLDVGGRSLLSWVIAAAQASRCDDVLVVVGEQADRVGREAVAAGVRTVLNPRFADGMGTSIAAGIAALAAECEAAVILLGDQPRLDAGAINALIDAYRSSGKPIVATRTAAALGAPTLIARPLFAEAAALSGDSGGRPLIRRHPDLVVEVAIESDATLWDVDTPEDLKRLRRVLGRKIAKKDAPSSGAPPSKRHSASS
jgi:molybdenum cofactor cytidylyltransferase